MSPILSIQHQASTHRSCGSSSRSSSSIKGNKGSKSKRNAKWDLPFFFSVSVLFFSFLCSLSLRPSHPIALAAQHTYGWAGEINFFILILLPFLCCLCGWMRARSGAVLSRLPLLHFQEEEKVFKTVCERRRRKSLVRGFRSRVPAIKAFTQSPVSFFSLDPKDGKKIARIFLTRAERKLIDRGNLAGKSKAT